jgi:hypothetical protein
LQEEAKKDTGHKLADQCRQLGALRKLRERTGNDEKNQNDQKNVQNPILPGPGATMSTSGASTWVRQTTLSCRLTVAGIAANTVFADKAMGAGSDFCKKPASGRLELAAYQSRPHADGLSETDTGANA